MRLFQTLGLAGALVVSVGAAAAEKWGVAELKIAQDSALASFKDQSGDELYAAIVGLSIERSNSGTSARAKIIYLQNEVKRTKTYFCHVHEEDEIDCH